MTDAEIETVTSDGVGFARTLARLESRDPLVVKTGHLKHGPGGLGGSGPCDVDCAKCDLEAKGQAKHFMPTTATEWMAVLASAGIDSDPPAAVWAPTDPLDVLYDGVSLRALLVGDEFNRRESGSGYWRSAPPTPTQRAAVSAHWSAELRAKVAATKQAERCRVTITHDEDD